MTTSIPQILVVEDERLVASALQIELEQFGYEVAGIASSAHEAVAQANEHRPDLVLMDIHLKGEVDGIEAGRQIHAEFGVPVVYLSAFYDPATVARASETQAFGYLLKPYEERELQTTIEIALAKHRAERQLEETQRWLAAIHNGISEAVIGVDREGRIRMMNAATEALTGWRKEDVVGQPVAHVCHLMTAAGRIELDEFADEVLRSTRSVELPPATWAIARDNRETPVEGALSAIRDSRFAVLGTVLTLRNISARLELDRLRRQSDERMRRVQKMEAVSQVASGMAQHLDSQLMAILGNTSLALAAIPDKVEGRELLHCVEVAAQQAAGLVQRLLMFSTLSRRTASKFHEVDLNLLVPEFLKEIKSRLDPDIAVAFRPGAGLWPVKADEPLLGQVLVELSLNAQDSMPNGGQMSVELDNVTLTEADLENHSHGQVGEFVRLRVSDSGRGMKPAVRARVFEACFTTRDRGEAAGLGLALVSAVVEQHHGWVECASQPGHGTQFDLYLPRQGGKDMSGS